MVPGCGTALGEHLRSAACVYHGQELRAAFLGGAYGVLGLMWFFLWWRGTCRAAVAVGMVDALAKDLNLIPLDDRRPVKEAAPEPAPALPEAGPVERPVGEGAV